MNWGNADFNKYLCKVFKNVHMKGTYGLRLQSALAPLSPDAAPQVSTPTDRFT